VSDISHDPANYCYRHPDRQSFVLCQRCGRTICPECQTQAAVGVHCPECTREARQSSPRTKPAIVTRMRTASGGGAPVVTYTLMALCVVAFIAQSFVPIVGFYLSYSPQLTTYLPFTMVTSLFGHASIIHLLLNMYSLFIFGPIIESLVGKTRYLALYLLAGFGGSVAVLLIDPAIGVLGASGAIFGLLGAFFVIQRRVGGSSIQLFIVIALNLVLGFVIPGVSWQAHVGGLVVGSLVAFIYLETRAIKRRPVQIALLVAVAAVLVVLTVVGVNLLPARLS
jgi:membrane associated rhomboid family serine protease